MDVFDAFPNAVTSGIWQICEQIRNTEVGKAVGEGSALDVIEDEVGNGHLDEAPNADWMASDTLLYVRPSQLPTLKSAELVANYLCYDGHDYYEIREVGIGKNQETGEIEHVELRIRATEVADGE